MTQVVKAVNKTGIYKGLFQKIANVGADMKGLEDDVIQHIYLF